MNQISTNKRPLGQSQESLFEEIQTKIALYNKQNEELQEIGVLEQKLKKLKLSFDEPQPKQPPVKCAFKKLREGAKTYHEIQDFKTLQRRKTVEYFFSFLLLICDF